jgi:hypothetical protein
MRSQNRKLSSLRFVDPTRWRAEIIAALKLEHAYIAPTADRLNISERTLSRWLADDADLRIARRNLIRDQEKQEKTA